MEEQPPLFENLKDSSHMKNGSPVLDPKDSNGWSIKGLGGRPKSAKQVKSHSGHHFDSKSAI